MVSDLTALVLAGVLAAVVLAAGVLAVIGLRRRDGDSAGEIERASEFGERPRVTRPGGRTAWPRATELRRRTRPASQDQTGQGSTGQDGGRS